MKQLEPLKERLKQLEAEVAKTKTRTEGGTGSCRGGTKRRGSIAAGSSVCKDGPCPPPPLPVLIGFETDSRSNP